MNREETEKMEHAIDILRFGIARHEERAATLEGRMNYLIANVRYVEAIQTARAALREYDRLRGARAAGAYGYY